MAESLFTVELRSEVDGNKLTGYGAVFNQYTGVTNS